MMRIRTPVLRYSLARLFPLLLPLFSYRQSHQNVGGKNDKSDARLLARLLCERINILKPLRLEDQQTRKLELLCPNRGYLVDQRAKSLVRLISHVKDRFPILLERERTWNATLSGSIC